MDTDSFVIKDSGKREEFEGGMVRDTTEGKTNWALVADGPMLRRWAVHLTKGALKYEARNWLKAQGQVELDRAKESAFRHFMQWYNGDMDEDHAAAVFFNINEVEYIKMIGSQQVHQMYLRNQSTGETLPFNPHSSNGLNPQTAAEINVSTTTERISFGESIGGLNAPPTKGWYFK